MKTEERRKQLLDLMFENFVDCGVELRGWVVLPNHYHLLVYLGGVGNEGSSQVGNEGSSQVGNEGLSPHYEPHYERVGQVLQRVHGSLSRQWNLEDKTVGRKVWYRYSDRAIRSERHYHTTLNYIHYNPVKHGWAASPYDWLCSSVHWYLVQRGREWLRDAWMQYPVKEYGKGWDELDEGKIASLK